MAVADESKVVIYTDGGADPNPGIGGWAAVLQYGEHERVLSGSAPDTTNNRMELTAAIEALATLKRPCQIEFYTDSEYLRRGITQWLAGWKQRGWRRSNGKPVPNVDLWQRLEPLTEQHQIDWHWVRGHAGNELNERVDRLAREARLEITPSVTIAADTPRLYVRASCRGNPGPGGWGAVLETLDDSRQSSGSAAQTTNNRMELMAIVEGLAMLPSGSAVQIFTTSDYVYQGATKWIHGWRRRNWQKRNGSPIANGDLWQRVDELMQQYQISWISAKGSSNEALDIAGKLATEAVSLENM